MLENLIRESYRVGSDIGGFDCRAASSVRCDVSPIAAREMTAMHQGEIYQMQIAQKRSNKEGDLISGLWVSAQAFGGDCVRFFKKKSSPVILHKNH